VKPVRRAVAGLLPAVACLCIAVAGCDGERAPSADPRAPLPAPKVTLSAADRASWAPSAAARDAVPVLVYRDVEPAAFARHMTLLDHAGYDTITLDQLARFVDGEPVSLPPRPILLTFDGGLLDSYRQTDAILRRLGFGAVLFVDVGPVEEGDPAHLTYEELERLQAGGRWDVQLQSGTGNRRIRYGTGPGDVGAFYAYRGTEEVLGGWRERVFSDVTYAEDQLTHHVRGYRPLAFAPPYGNYGQAGTNDRRIPRLLLERLELSFPLVFTQDRDGFATPGAGNPLGRFEITRDTTEAELRAMLASGSA
jgi:peptidoglycan/xylan/chitin deacetylase (PgdA/CDA1 family)